MLLSRRYRARLPQQTDFIHQRNEYLVKNFSEGFFRKQIGIGFKKQHLVKIHHRQFERVDGVALGTFF